MLARFQTHAKLVIAVVGALLLVSLATPVYWDWVETAAFRIRTPEPRTDYAFGLLWGAALFLSFWLWPVPASERRSLLWLWLAKLETMLGYMLVYEWNYGLDAYYYYFVGNHTAPGDVSFAEHRGNALIFWLSSLQSHLLIADSYHATKITFGYLGLVSTYAFYRAARSFAPGCPEGVLWILALFPSTLQWTSILGKDPIVALGVGMYAWGAARVYRREGWGLPLLAAGVMLSWWIRPWMAAILTLPLLLLFLSSKTSPLRTAMISGTALVAVVVSVAGFQDFFKIREVEDVVERSTQISQGFSSGGSARESEMTTREPQSLGAMLAFAPIGLVSALIRPLPGEILNLFGILAGLENLVVLGLVYLALRQRSKTTWSQPPIRWALALICCWGLVYGYVCFHNAGTSVRYRQQIFPVWVGVLLALGNRGKGVAAGKISVIRGA